MIAVAESLTACGHVKDFSCEVAVQNLRENRVAMPDRFLRIKTRSVRSMQVWDEEQPQRSGGVRRQSATSETSSANGSTVRRARHTPQGH